MMLPRLRVLVLLACGLLAFTVLPTRAIEQLRLSLGDLAADGWSVQAMSVQLGIIDDAHAVVEVRARQIRLPDGLGTLTDVVLGCQQARLTSTLVSCPQAVLTARSSEFGKQRIHSTFQYRLDSGDITAEISNIALHGGKAALAMKTSAAGWQFKLRASAISLVDIVQQLTAFGVPLPAIEGEGRADLTAHIQGKGSRLSHATLDGQLRADELSDAAGSLAAEQLIVDWHADIKQGSDAYHVELAINADQGALYVDPLFVQLQDQPIVLKTRFDWRARTQRLTVHSLDYLHTDSLELQASAALDLSAASPLRQLQLHVNKAQFPSAFDTYLQPWLYDSGFAELDTRGHLRAAVTLKGGSLSTLTIEPQALTVDDREGRFELQAMRGVLRWSNSPDPLASTLSWTGGRVFDVALGPTELRLESTNDSLRLLKRAAIPVLDGVLRVDTLQMEFAEDTPLRWQVNGLLEPVSLSDLTVALGWPELSGKLSGVIPDIRYDGGNLEVGGILLIRVFDGEITLQNLTLEQPFGLVPRLQVDARARGIDLETLTRTFSFGRIEGRLDGRIDGLDMVSWQPVAFDAEFATPEDDESRHRISQKAVDNISSIGGAGVGGALSRSFLRFFEDFPYDRLGIRCRLQQGVCDMGGVAAAQDGYYLVKGRLIPPRLDVIGYAERVDWDSLIAQIMAVTTQQEVVVE